MTATTPGTIELPTSADEHAATVAATVTRLGVGEVVELFEELFQGPALLRAFAAAFPEEVAAEDPEDTTLMAMAKDEEKLATFRELIAALLQGPSVLVQAGDLTLARELADKESERAAHAQLTHPTVEDIAERRFVDALVAALRELHEQVRHVAVDRSIAVST